MPPTETVRREVIFLFGAGASVDAGIPDTYQFVEDFRSYVKNSRPQLYELLSKIIKIRERFNCRVYGQERQQVDVEQLLDALRRLIDIELEPLLDFYEEKKFCLTLDKSDLSELKTLLEDFIREKVIAKKEKLEYLKALLNFDTPLEIYSTNYDTCIEQLSYLNHRKYTDGFDVYWNGENFKKDYDIKHYKLHGSVIWYQNIKTKECVKIPVHAFSEGKPVNLKLIYEEDVKPLLIYPAQKSEYIEPLTDLQLMFKQRLFSKDTKVLVVVGYSFRDDYIVHMLWDAARANEDLHIIFIAPNSKEIFDKRLKLIDKDSPSRIHDRVICLPYPFCKVIYQLRNKYLNNLSYLLRVEEEAIETERAGYNADEEWQMVLRSAIDCEYLTKAESALQNIKKNWNELNLGNLAPQALLHYAFKGLLHSVVLNDGNENKWLERINKSLEIFDADKLQAIEPTIDHFNLVFMFSNGSFRFKQVIDNWIDPLIQIWKEKLQLLSPKYEAKLEKVTKAYTAIEKFRKYLSLFENSVSWNQYIELRKNTYDIKRIITLLDSGSQDWDRIKMIVTNIERSEFIKWFGKTRFQLEIS